VAREEDVRDRRLYQTALALAVFAVTLASLAVAVAVTSRLTDPDDVAGVLDVRRVKFSQPEGESPSWTVITASSWTVSALWDRGYVFLELDTKGTELADYYALVRSDGRSLRGELFKIARKPHRPDPHVSNLTVWRKGHDGVSVKVPLKAMEFGRFRAFYRWWIVTSLTGEKCPTTCIDRVPDESGVQQWRPGMSPTPTPTATPTPTVTPSP
jgi:hypothetical protein